MMTISWVRFQARFSLALTQTFIASLQKWRKTICGKRHGWAEVKTNWILETRMVWEEEWRAWTQDSSRNCHASHVMTGPSVTSMTTPIHASKSPLMIAPLKEIAPAEKKKRLTIAKDKRMIQSIVSSRLCKFFLFLISLICSRRISLSLCQISLNLCLANRV